MLTIKLMKYGPEGRAVTPNTFTEAVVFHTAKEIFLNYEKDGRAVLSFDDKSLTVGEVGQTMFDVAYIMNDTAKTIETVR